MSGISSLFQYDFMRNAVLAVLAHQELVPVLDEILQLTADSFPGVFFSVISGGGHHLVCTAGPGNEVQVLPGQVGQLF